MSIRDRSRRKTSRAFNQSNYEQELWHHLSLFSLVDISFIVLKQYKSRFYTSLFIILEFFLKQGRPALVNIGQRNESTKIEFVYHGHRENVAISG